ncbi:MULTISPECIES: LruC domain-containing protein [unclassified Polaribacter]|uniref:LruC domain-containing protein n=1 Tax=unclassified Polaribacter TaxID=196858 RepID=UPI0011BDE1EB|nr:MULTISPECIES: LruC domain-containing protein [unclassified Polaribacter]TXD54040.1 LruC domain-containing protein [Polaribacter sp. IC063]TXD62556.1 LruC domain-containing protein [Polaribacter sp. IC066]
MKTKFFTLIILLTLLQGCTNEFPKDKAESVAYITDDITTLVVPKGHDLRPITLQNTNINLSEESKADIVKIKIFKIENDTYKLLFDGAIDREKSISSLIKIPNHVGLLAVQADLARGTREWVLTPNELGSLVIEDEVLIDEEDSENKSATAAKTSAAFSKDNPPSWNCGDYAEFNGNDDGNFQITTNSTQSLTVTKNTSIYICSGSSWNPTLLTDWGSKLTIYVASGASLSLRGSLYSTTYNEGTFNGVNTIFTNKSEFNNWGTANIVGNLGVFSDEINIYGGTCNISGSLSIEGHFDNDGGTVNVGGSVTISDKLHNKEGSTLKVGGDFTVNSGEFKNECKTTISGNFVNSKKVEFKNASYTAITGSFTSNPSTDIKIEEGSIFKCASITSGGNIKGNHGYSIIETGSITFWSSSKQFKGELDICSNSYTDGMGDNKVINSCTTFISTSACSLGYNNAVDNDNDGAIAGVDVDDNNASVASYQYPQGQNTFFTSLYEDLYPCMGDYDLNDLVHNYTYQESISNGENASITEIKFNYKFPAIGAGFNNSLVLRVMDEDNNATLNLESSDRYASSKITRMHDSQNNTTLFIFNNIKTIYTENVSGIINTVEIEYSDIPVISGTVSNINGAYDEFILQDGKLGHEIHPLYNELHRNYSALNTPTMYNDANNFSRCDDKSLGDGNLFINANGFPWVLTDLPMDLPWPKEGVLILEAYPNFDDFVISNPALDWYSSINGNREESQIIK